MFTLLQCPDQKRQNTTFWKAGYSGVEIPEKSEDWRL